MEDAARRMKKIDEDSTWNFKEFVSALTISSIFLHQSMYIGFKGVYCESHSEYFKNLNVICLNTLSVCFNNSLHKNVSYTSLMLYKREWWFREWKWQKIDVKQWQNLWTFTCKNHEFHI